MVVVKKDTHKEDRIMKGITPQLMRHHTNMHPINPDILMCMELLWNPDHIQCLYLFVDVNLKVNVARYSAHTNTPTVL